MTTRKIPWINDGNVGFFEYDMELYGYVLVGRNKFQLQEEVTKLLIHQNYDKACDYIRRETPTEYNKWSNAQKAEIFVNDLISQRINDLDYVNSVKKKLVTDGEIYPDDATIEDIGFNSRYFTDEDIEELRYLVESVPDLTQDDLEDIYLRQNSQNPKYLLHRKMIEDSKKEVERYNKDIEVSKSLTQLYEKILNAESLISGITETIKTLFGK